jgi:hypothetical protein
MTKYMDPLSTWKTLRCLPVIDLDRNKKGIFRGGNGLRVSARERLSLLATIYKLTGLLTERVYPLTDAQLSALICSLSTT